MEKVSVIIPAYNEEDTIGATLESLKNLQEIKEIIVVNDGSSDLTGEIARQYEVKVIDLPQNEGKGKAVQEGIAEAALDIIALIDADLGSTAREIEKLIGPIASNEADMIIARFKGASAGGGFGIMRKIASLIIKLITGEEITSPLSGQRVFKKEILGRTGKLAGGFGLEFALTVDTLNRGFRIKEVETNMTHRIYGKNLRGFIHRGKQFIDILQAVIKQKQRIN